MKPKKTHSMTPKKSDAKKNMEAKNGFDRSQSLDSKTKSYYSKQTMRRNRNEFDDTDY